MTELVIIAVILLASIFNAGDTNDHCVGQYCFFCESAEFQCGEKPDEEE